MFAKRNQTREGIDAQAPCPAPSDRAALVLQWSRLVHRVLADLRHFRMVRRHPDDCAGAGQIALVKAARLWREDGSAPFPVYAYHAIKNTVLNEVRRLERIHRRERRYPAPLAKREALDPWARCDPDRFDPAPVRAAVAELPPRERRIVEAHYGLDGAGGRTFKEAGAAVGVSRSRAQQLHAGALATLAGLLASEGRDS